MLDDVQLVKHFPALLKGLKARIKALPTSLPTAAPDGPLARYLGDLEIDTDEGARYTANRQWERTFQVSEEEQRKRIVLGKYGMDLVCPFLEFYSQQDGIKDTDGVGIPGTGPPPGAVPTADFFAPRKGKTPESKSVVPAKRSAAPDSDDDPNDKNYKPPHNHTVLSEEETEGPEATMPTEENIHQSMIRDKIAEGELDKPVSVLYITDGDPYPEKEDSMFRTCTETYQQLRRTKPGIGCLLNMIVLFDMGRDGSSKKRTHARISKSERKNLRLWVEGTREGILSPYLEYGAAMDRGLVAERKMLKKVCREYHAPILPETLPEDQEAAQLGCVKLLNARIQRWFRYRIRRTQKYCRMSGLDPLKDPYAHIVAKLSGLQAPPKARQAYQQFMHESYEQLCAPVIEKKRAEKVRTNPALRNKKPKVGFSATIARQIFEKLPEEERKKNRGSSESRAHHAALNRLPDFIAPILQEIYNVTSVSFGRNLTSAGDHWGRWDEARFARQRLKIARTQLSLGLRKLASREAGVKERAELPSDESDEDLLSGSDNDKAPPKKRCMKGVSYARSALSHPAPLLPSSQLTAASSQVPSSQPTVPSIEQAALPSQHAATSSSLHPADLPDSTGRGEQGYVFGGLQAEDQQDWMFPVDGFDDWDNLGMLGTTILPSSSNEAQAITLPTLNPFPNLVPVNTPPIVPAATFNGQSHAPGLSPQESVRFGSTSGLLAAAATPVGSTTSHGPSVASSRLSLPPLAIPAVGDPALVNTAIPTVPSLQPGHGWRRRCFEEGPDKLPVKGRPPSITAWIRSNAVEPRIRNVRAFAQAWQQWWDNLRPTWRSKREDGSWSMEYGYGEKGT
ncbi:hypothetical protein B0H14DRAFT_3473476 [Mycena olivaceomarginata]|nr:hypothetical protein B0H14DRAFT_3473476 [Mycena olivaceomarginata]